MKYLFVILFILISVYCYKSEEILQQHLRIRRTANRFDHPSGKGDLNKAGECVRPSCKKITSQMLALMDHGEEFCDHFHQKICQGSETINRNDLALNKYFTQLANYLHNSSQTNSFTHTSFSNIYQSCLKYNLKFDFQKRMQFVTNYSETDLTKIFTDMVLTQSLPFFDIGLDIKKTGHSSIYKFQITLPDESPLKTTRRIWQTKENIKVRCLQIMDKNTSDLDELNKIYKNCVSELLSSRIKNYVEDARYLLQNEYVGVDASTVIDFSQEVEKILPNSAQIQESKIENSCQTVTVANLTKKYNIIDWSKFFTELSNKTINNEEEIKLCFTEYMDRLFDKFSKSSRKLDVNSNTSQLVGILRALYSYQLYENLIISEAENREFYCMDLTAQLMPELATNIMYEIQDKNYLNRRNVQIAMLFNKLQDTLEKSLESAKMNDEVRQIFRKRLLEIKLNLISIGNSNSVLNVYNQLETDSNKYQQTVLELLQTYRKTVYSLVNKEVKASALLNYFVTPFDAQPRSFYGSNIIVFHPAIYLTFPENLPEYINIARQGIHLAHELVKHFDRIGKWYLESPDVVADFYNALTLQTQMLFECYRENFNSFNIQSISGSLLVNEMIVDSAAFRLIADTIDKLQPLENMIWVHETYSPLQIFMIIAAQEYCHISTPENFMFSLYENHVLPSEVKIKNMLSNYEHFQSMFYCADGSDMFLDSQFFVQFPYIQEEEEKEEEEEEGQEEQVEGNVYEDLENSSEHAMNSYQEKSDY